MVTFYLPHFFYLINWNSSVRKNCSFSPIYSFIYLFNHLFISVWTHGYLFSSSGYNIMLLLFILFDQILPALATGSSFRSLLCPFDMLLSFFLFCGGALPYFLALCMQFLCKPNRHCHLGGYLFVKYLLISSLVDILTFFLSLLLSFKHYEYPKLHWKVKVWKIHWEGKEGEIYVDRACFPIPSFIYGRGQVAQPL